MKQKTTLTRSRWLFACLLSLLMTLGGASPAWGDELTVHDGSNTHESIPFNAYNADSGYGDKGEFVIPASDLTSINGKTLTGLKFYTNLNVSLTGTFQVFLKEVASTTLSSLSGTTGATTVYTGTLAATSNVMTINFSSNYVYGGGNLLVGIYMTTKGNCSLYGFAFKGTTTEENNAYYSYGYSSAGTATFIPKTTIITQTEGPGFEVKDGSTTIESPFAYNFGLAESGDTKVFTLSNPGTEATPISVNTTGANGFTATVEGNATSIPAGETKTLTITMPDATASGSIVVTPTGDGLSAFTFNVNGTKRDPNKVYLDFSDGQMPDGWSWVPIGSYASNYSCSVHEGYISWAQYGGSSYAWAFTSPKLNFENGELIAFETAKYGSSTSYNPSVTVEYSLDGNTWTAIGSAFTDDTYGNWTKHSVNIPVDGVKYIRFNGWYIHMRNIYGGELPLNPTPQNLAYSNVTNASAQLSWTSTAANFNIRYKTTSAGEWTTIENVTANPYTLTGLTAETGYQVKVQADHGVNGLSDYTDPVSFTTKPNPISVYPYTENFNSLTSSGQIPAFWDNSEGTTTNANYKWSYIASGHDGACVRFESDYNSTNNTNFLKTRPFSWESGKTMKLSFWYKNAKGGDFSVYASTDGGSTYPTQLATGLTNKSEWTLEEITLPAAVYGNNVVIVFKGTSNYATGGAILLDDVTISEVSAYSMSVSGGDVSENTIAFGTVKNTTTTKTFTINNDGSGDLTNVSVVSSDDTKFTVSDTGFDIAAGATKDITVTFVKEEEANYSETITISQANVTTPIELTVTATYQAPTPATIAVKLNDVAVGASVPFGTVGKAKTKTFTVANTGEATLNITSIVSSNTTDFTVSPASLDVAGGETGEFTVTFVWDGDALNAEKTANITITSSNTGLDPISFTTTGTRADLWSEDFSANSLPDGWATDGTTGWTFADNVAKGHYAYGSTSYYLTTPSLKVAAVSDVLTFDYIATGNYVSIAIEKSKNGGAWESCSTATPIGSLNNGNAGTATITGLEAGNYKFRFKNDDYNLDNFEGFKLNLNDPTIAVYSDSEATQEVATATTKDFGWVADDADDAAFTSTYYIKNNGTGTLTISNISEVEGFTAATAGDVMTVAAGADPLALTITMDKNAVGAKSGTFTLTTDGGNFTIPVKGFVCDHSKNLVDFTANGAKFPAGWTAGSWTITDGAAISTSSSTIQTKKFTVAANENLYIDIKGNESAYETKALSYSYSIDNGENWSEATSLVASTTGTVNDQVFTISDIASTTEERTVLIRITGQKLGIKHIYGFTRVDEAVMTTTAVAHDFGMQASDVEPATNAYVFTVSNEGNIDLTNLAVTLGNGNESAFTVAVAGNKTTLAAGESVDVTVTMKSSTVYGAKNDNLTIAADEQTPVVIALTGKTRDASKQYIEFTSAIPDGWTSNGWSVYNGEARTTNGTLRTTPLTIAANETMAVDARISNSNSGSLKVRYTTNNGVDWQETTIPAVYNYTTCSTYTFNLGNTENAVTAFFEFVGENAVIDNFYGGVATTAPLLEVTENTSAVANNANFDFGSNLQAEPAAKVFTLANKGNASMDVTIAKTDDVTVTPAAATIAAGGTADVTVSLPYDQANVGDKTGAVTITLGTAVFTLNFTGNTIDPTALNEELASLPAGWYNAGWTVDGSAHIYYGVEKELITEQYGAEAGKNVLSFKAKAQSGNEGTLKVYTSTDRKTWSEPTEFAMTNEYATKSLDALADGNYYVKFVSSNANIDDLTGLKKITTAPEHDLYVSASDIPTATKVPKTSITATATVYSLRAAETGVYAKLFFDNVEVATAAAQDISLNGSKTFELTGNVPAAEKTYAARIVVYYSNNSVAFETATTDVEVQHTRTLAITAFERDGEGDLSADVDNKITAQFNVTVQNNSTCDLTADEVKVSIVNAAGEVYQMNDADNVTAATAVLAKDASVVIPVTLTISAGEGGDFKFRAKELVSNTATLEANDITIHVNAQAPQFALNIKGGAALADGDDVAFGLVKEATTKHYTISNTGTKALVLTSIAAPAGYSVTEINDVNKTIAVNGTLDIDVTLLAEQGKKAGDLVFTYDVNGTPTTFTLALTGRSEAANVWEEYFATEIPATWQKTGWTWNDDCQTAYSGGVQGEFTLMTPRLSAAAGQVLTYETKWQYDGENMTVQYSTDKTSWTDYETITASTETVEHQFVAPAAGNYYLKFTANRYVNLDNFIGFTLNIPEHDMELTASDVPTTGKRLNSYVATVTLKENAGKNENITAELWVNGANVNATTDVTSVEANSNATVVTLTWEPQSTLDAVNAYVKVTYAGSTLETTPVSLTIADVYTLSENSSNAVEVVTNETIMLERSFVAGWNTVCLPFAVADNTTIESLFGAGTKVFNFKNFANNMIDFEAVTTMSAATPYLIYVPAAITEPIRVDNVTISNLNTTAGTVWHNNITFHGSYAPVDAGNLAGKYGVTPSNQLAKGNDNTTMKGFRGYFEGNLASARISIFDEATGISKVYAPADLFGDNDRVYNLGGQKVENAKKGVYIVNGRKVVVK